MLSVAITNDGKTIVSGSGDKTIKIWSFETGLVISTLGGENGLVLALAIS